MHAETEARSEMKSPECVADRVANQEILARLVSKLTEREARIVAYRFIDAMGLKNIAELMDLSEKTVQRELTGIQERNAELGRIL